MPNNDKIDSFLDKKPAQEVVKVDPNTGEVVRVGQIVDPDFDMVRKNIKDVIETGMQSFQELAQQAATSQAARDYEVLDRMVTTMIQANRSLLDVNREQRLDVEGETKEEKPGVTNVLVISPAELLAKLKPSEEDELE